ncbi:MAG: sulfotransferase family protein [Bacteroidota bacterium]|nr:sulfotransferase family protein [Bacteroidota bacterium]
MCKNICLWSTPRNVSTALMYSFAQRSDTQVFDEILYGHYLKFSGVNHPGRDQVINSLETNRQKVINKIITKEGSKINFYKLMTHFLFGVNINFLEKVHNILLIRNPSEVIASYSKVISSPDIRDIGIKMQYELYNYLNRKKIPVVLLDSKELLQNPKEALTQLCNKINIPFDKSMLSWPKGPKKEDGCWANYWYSSVHKSTKFNTYIAKKVDLKGYNKQLEIQAMNYYNFLHSKSIKV